MDATILSNEEFNIEAFKKKFNRAYSAWFRAHSLPTQLRTEIENQQITMELFDALTLGKQLQRYISLIDSRMRFEEIPVAPHGSIIGIVEAITISQLGGCIGQSPLRMMHDDGSFILKEISNYFRLSLGRTK
jgi:hypothetical protein